MRITVAEFKKNLSRYFEFVKNEDITITKNGKEIAVLTRGHLDKLEILESLVGIAKGSGDPIDVDAIREEAILNR